MVGFGWRRHHRRQEHNDTDTRERNLKDERIASFLPKQKRRVDKGENGSHI
jgi:hypothetical protein